MATLIRSSALLAAALAVGRLIGFLREVLLAARLGVSAEADIAVVILTLPDFLVGLLLTGGFTAALIPALKAADGEVRASLFAYVATLAGIVGIVVGAGLALAPGVVFALLAPGLAEEVTTPWHWTLGLVGLSVPLAAWSGVTGAWLNVRGIFFAVGLGTVIYNLVLCAALLHDRDPTDVLKALAWAVLGAGMARVGFLGFVGNPPLRPRLTAPAGADARLARLFAAGVLATGVIVFSGILFRTIAASAGSGALSQFAYAFRLFELPMALVLTPVTTVLLPSLSQNPDPRLVRRAGLVLVVLSLTALAIGLGPGEAIAGLIYGRGEIDAAALAGIAGTATWMFCALPFAALGLLGSTVLNARRQTGIFFQNALAALALSGAVALANPDWVLPAFVLFHATLAVLNLLRSGVVGMVVR